MHSWAQRIAFIGSLILFSSTSSLSQLTLAIEKVDTSRYPTIQVHLVTRENGVVRRDLAASNYSLKEDGFIQSPLSFNCPQGNEPFSVAFVVGVGGSMSQSMLDAAKSTGDAVISLMNGTSDEGALLSYHSSVVTDVGITTDKVLIQNGFSSLQVFATASNHLWDGITDAINEVRGSGSNNSKAVLVISNGIDDGSGADMNSVIAVALTQGIKVYTVGVPGAGGTGNLQAVAVGTGGKFWPGAQGNFAQEFVTLLRGTPDACILEYMTNNLCRDGFSRLIHVDATVNSNTASSERNYHMRQDTNTYQTAAFRVDTDTVKSGNMKYLPIRLLTGLNNKRFYPAQVVLSFDTSKAKLLSIDPAGTLSDSLNVAVTNLATGALIDFSKTKIINGSGVFLKLLFQVVAVDQSVSVPVVFSSFTFSQGCLVPQIASGALNIYPKSRAISYTATHPAIVVWDSLTKNYSPNPVLIEVKVKNIGELPITNVAGNLALSNGLSFLAGYGEQQTAIPPTLNPNEEAALKWEIKIDVQTADKIFSLPLNITTTEGTTKSGVLQMTVKQAGPKLTMLCLPPTIVVENNAYKPNPFALAASIENKGGSDASMQATVVLPFGLSLSNDVATKAVPLVAPNGQQSVQWNVLARNSSRARDYDVLVIIQGARAKTDTCTMKISLPALNVPDVVFQCIDVPAITYDGTKKNYTPNPFNADGSLTNQGVDIADSVRAVLQLPSELRFVGGGQQKEIFVSKLNPSQTSPMQFPIEIPSLLCVAKNVQAHLEIFVKGVKVGECDKVIALPAKPNAKPRILSVAPATLDTARIGAPVQFSLQVTDDDSDRITYAWTLNGVSIGSNTSSLSHQFTARGQSRIVCTISDGCASDSAVWNFFVDYPLSISDARHARGFFLEQNSPNPFSLSSTHASTTIAFVLPVGEHEVDLTLLDVSGREVGTILHGTFEEGMHQIVFQPLADVHFANKPLSTGIFFYRLRSGAFQQIRSMIVIR